MRTTQIMLAMEFGGAERYFVDLSRELARMGHPVQAICHERFPRLDLLEDQENLELVPVKVGGSWSPWGHRAIERHMGDFAPAVIHAHMARAAHFGGRAGHHLGVPVVAKTHNYVKLKYYRYVQAFITTTQDQRDYLLRQGVGATRISVIPNFSSLPALDKPALLNHDPLCFAAYGRMVPKKGFDVLLEAFAECVSSGLSGRLILGGNGPKYGELRKQAEELGLTDVVVLLGWVEDVRSFLSSADVFVLPSRDEPFGIAILEAMALAKPIISTRTQGPSEILNANTALLVAPGNVAQLAEAIWLVEKHRSEARARAQQALELFRSTYSKDAVIPRLLALYESLQRQPSRH